MKQLSSLFAVLLLLFATNFLQAQVSVTATAGTAGPTAYTTLNAAFTAINAGTHQGVLTLDVTASTTETASAVLNASGSGAAAYTAMTIQPSGGSYTIAGALPGAVLVDLNGADNVTINGLNSGGNALTLENSSNATTTLTLVLRLINDASTNTITNCTLKSSSLIAGNGGAVLFSTSTGTSGNDNNTISSCNFRPSGSNLPARYIIFSGSTTSAAVANSGNTITSCDFADCFAPAIASTFINFAGGALSTTISNNKFYQTATRTQTTGAAHQIISSSSSSNNEGFTITGNTFGFATNANTGAYTMVFPVSSASKCQALHLGSASTGNGLTSSIQGNTVAGFAISGGASGTSSSAAFLGIYVGSALATIGNVTGNTIGGSGVNAIAYTSSSTSTSEVYGIYYFPSLVSNIRNNTVSGITATNTTSASLIMYGIRANTSSLFTNTFVVNIIGTSTAPLTVSSTVATGSRVIGLYSQAGACLASGNVISFLSNNAPNVGTGSSASVIGFWNDNTSASAVGSLVDANTIHTLSNTNATAATSVTGMQYNGTTTVVAGITHNVSRNTIYNINASSTSASAVVNGIAIQGGNTNYSNNMIALGSGIANSPIISGINETTAGTDNIYHNSVLIMGTASAGTGNSYPLQSTITTNVRSYLNNNFVNLRTGGTGKHYAVRYGSNTTGLTANNNNFYAAGAVLGQFNNLDQADLATWKTATGKDGSSLNVVANFVTATSSTLPNLNIDAAVATFLNNTGVALPAVTVDHGGDARSATTPDIGCDEFAGTTPPCVGTPAGGTSTASAATICTGQAVTISNNAANSLPGLTYQWASATTTGGPYTDIAGAVAQTYTTTVTSSGSLFYVLKAICDVTIVNSTEASVTINQTPTAAASSNAPVCATQAINLVTTTDVGTTFAWAGPSFTSINQNPVIAAAATTHTGIYTVTVTNSGCTKTATTTVLVNPSPTSMVAATTTALICGGSAVNLTSSATNTYLSPLFSENFNGGTNTFTTVNNSTGGTPANGAWTLRNSPYVLSSAPTLSSSDASQFYHSNSDAQGSGSVASTLLISPVINCTGFTGIQIGFNNYFRMNIASSDFGYVEASTNGTDWTIVDTQNSNSGPTSGGYVMPVRTVTLPAAYNNSATLQVRFRNQQAYGYYWAVDNVVVVGSAPLAYSWTTSPAGFTSAVQNPMTVTPPVGVNTYTVVATNGAGCTASATTSVTVQPALAVTATSAPVVCNGGTTGSATAVGTGGNGTIAYTWNAGGATSAATNTGLAAGTYTVSITSGVCTTAATTSIVVSEPTALAVASASAVNALCFGSADGAVSVTGTGGTPAYTYTSSAVSTLLTGLTAGAYTVTITDANSCTITTGLTVGQPTALTATAAQSLPVSCNGGADGTATATPTGGTAPYVYAWSMGGSGATTTGLAAGTYTCTITDSHGCIITAEGTITQPDAIVVSIVSQTMVSCNGGSNATATLSATGGNGGYIGLSVTGLNAGPHTLTVTDSKGCTGTVVVTILQPTAVTVSATQTTPVTCNGLSTGSATAMGANGTPGYTYAWDNMVAAALSTGLNAGTHTVTVTDANGCTATNTVMITQPAVLTVSAISVAPTCATGAYQGTDNGTATALGAGGNPAYSYVWSNSAAMAAATGLTAGSYSVVATDSKGCTASTAAVVAQGAANTTYYKDADADGFGNVAITILSCTGVPATYAATSTDCNDNLATVFPGATEVCGSTVDVNCDGLVGFNPVPPSLVSSVGGTGNVTLTWSGSCTGRYRVQIQKQGQTTWTYYFAQGNVTTKTIALPAGTYKWTVRAQATPLSPYTNPVAATQNFTVN
jgi:trimeric autotransporter adhesin